MDNELNTWMDMNARQAETIRAMLNQIEKMKNCANCKYWMREIDNAPCNTCMSSLTFWEPCNA